MAAKNYDESLRRCLAHEGGYTNLAADPGGPTNFGITIFDYRKYINAGGTAADVKNMTVGQAKQIYRKRYWDAQSCDSLPPGVDYVIFDYGVNSGIGRSGKVLRRLLGLSTDTWAINQAVLAAAAKRDPKALVTAISDERLSFLRHLRTWPTFGRGWGTRVAETRATGLAMAAGLARSAAPGSTANGRGKLPKPNTTGVGAGGATGILGLGAWLHDWVLTHPTVSVMIGLVLLGGVAYLVSFLKDSHAHKADEPMPNATVVPEKPSETQAASV